MIPSLPDTAPFSADQRTWINGYLAGLFSGKDQPADAGATAALTPPDRGPLLFLWGSQTGGAQKLAKTFAKRSAASGFQSRAVGLEEASAAFLASAGRAVIVTSTYGDGEMPDNAQGFWNQIKNDSAPRMDKLKFAVLALGDTNYVRFCEAGKLFDQRLEELGACRIHPRMDCDADFEKPAAEWFGGLIKALGADSPTTAASDEATSDGAARSYSKERPFPAVVVGSRLLNRAGSAKEVRHIEIALAGSGLDYEVGDALGVMPSNCPDFVSEILVAAGLRGSEAVASHDGLPIRLALQERLDLAPFLRALPESGTSPDDLVKPLRKLQPRLYSISSSPKAHPDEVHLTVGIVRYEIDGRLRKGVCSTFLSDRCHSSVPVYVHSSPGFRPPVKGETPMIMVGPGTGIAPFRAFLEERRAVGATGKNWLFFGDQKADYDFLYQDELAALQHEGFLHRLDTAFSRDQERKVYVQHRMLENSAELWAWLEEGAHFYVCGDASRMAKDVDTALRQVVEKEGGLSADDALAYIAALKTQNRYQRDIY